MKEVGLMIYIMEKEGWIDKMDKFILVILVKDYFMEMDNRSGLMEIYMREHLLIQRDME